MFQRVLPVALAALLLAGCGAQRGLNTPAIGGGARTGAAVGAKSLTGVEKGIRAAFTYVFKQMDKDASGFLSAEEMSAEPSTGAAVVPTSMPAMDKNKDGKITLAEFSRPELRATVVTQFRVSMGKLFANLDVNGDRVLVADEMTNAGISIEAADRNKNSKVTLSEFEDGVAGLLAEGKGLGVTTPPAAPEPVVPAVEPVEEPAA